MKGQGITHQDARKLVCSCCGDELKNAFELHMLVSSASKFVNEEFKTSFISNPTGRSCSKKYLYKLKSDVDPNISNQLIINRNRIKILPRFTGKSWYINYVWKVLYVLMRKNRIWIFISSFFISETNLVFIVGHKKV